jgi:hypothetical protein
MQYNHFHVAFNNVDEKLRMSNRATDCHEFGILTADKYVIPGLARSSSVT